MPGRTPKGFPYSLGTDTADTIDTTMQALAERADAMPGVSSFTTTERNALAGADLWDGRIIWNRTTVRLERYNSGTSSWLEAEVLIFDAPPATSPDDYPFGVTMGVWQGVAGSPDPLSTFTVATFKRGTGGSCFQLATEAARGTPSGTPTGTERMFWRQGTGITIDAWGAWQQVDGGQRFERQRRLEIMRPGSMSAALSLRSVDHRGHLRIGPQAVTNAGNTLFTVPAGRIYIVKNIYVANVLGTGPGHFRLNMLNANHKVIDNCRVPMGQTMVIPMAMPLTPGEVVVGFNNREDLAALHVTLEVIDLPESEWAWIARGYAQDVAGGGATTIMDGGANGVLVTGWIVAAIENPNDGERTLQLTGGPWFRSRVDPHGGWEVHEAGWHLPAGASMGFENVGGGWSSALMWGVRGDF